MPGSAPLCNNPAILIPALPDDAADRARERQRRNPERETLWLAATSAAKVLGPRHSATKALAKASITMDRVEMWHGLGMAVTGQSVFPVTTVTSVRVRTPYI